MLRKIIHIDEKKCTGCGICANACHEGAIDIVDGKAKLVREHFCDGFGDCLPACPTGAITFEEREAPAYDAQAVKESQAMKAKEQAVNQINETPAKPAFSGCPGSRLRQFHRASEQTPAEAPAPVANNSPVSAPQSQLNQWPVQIKLLPVQAPFYQGAKLLIAADCTAYAYANIHQDFMKGKVTLIGCPKLDAVDYTEKLTQIISLNDIKSVTILRMEVPCCGGLQRAVEQAIKNSGKFLPWQVEIVSIDGNLLP